MGLLNQDEPVEHWVANIHLSGSFCNRSCVFCTGHYTPDLRGLHNLDEWPLKNLRKFTKEVVARNIKQVYLTGSNTDPMLYSHLEKLCTYLVVTIPDVRLGIKTNGALIPQFKREWKMFDEGIITVCSSNVALNRKMMGGDPPNMQKIVRLSRGMDLYVNIVLGKDNKQMDVLNTIQWLARVDYNNGKRIRRINVREPYGQAPIGNPFKNLEFAKPRFHIYGQPVYHWFHFPVCYWDVHYVKEGSLNLYANGEFETHYSATPNADQKTKYSLTHTRESTYIQVKGREVRVPTNEELREMFR